jgi:hypothetical protein
MEFGNRKMGRRMGHLKMKNKKVIEGEAKDIETIARLRPWMEDEWKAINGKFNKTILRTDYDANRDIFKFKIIFCI